MTTRSVERVKALLAATLLVALSFATRAPALVNAAGTNSDAAVVGLQARHILHHEWSPLLWGSGYQTSADSSWAALWFAVLGPSALVLMLSALSGYVALTLFAFAILNRRMSSPWRAFVATLPLVFTTACVHSYALYPPRQLALTLAFASLWAIDRGDGAKHTELWLSIGGLLAMIAWLADPYAVVFLPAATLLASLVVLRAYPSFGARVAASLSFLGAIAVGVVPLAALWLHPRAQRGVATMSTSVLAHNAKLLWHECLPWAIGTKIYKPLHVMDYVAWRMPLGYAVAAHAGVVFLVAAMVASAVFVLRRWTARPLADLFWLGATTIALVIASFLFSLMVMDHFSMRYLAAGVLVLPFVVAPLVERMGAGRAALVLAPYLFVAGAGGWLSHGDWTQKGRGLPTRTEAGRGANESKLLAEMQRRHVDAGVADYWASYRLDFLWREALPVVPLHATQDRYAPYRVQFEHAHRVAYVFDRDRSFENEAQAASEFDASGLNRIDRFEIGGFSVHVYDRP